MTFKADFDPPEHKPFLTPTEKLQAAYNHIILGFDQHVVAAQFHVNSARVADAVKAARVAFCREDIIPKENRDAQLKL